MLRIKLFRAIDDLESCQRFAEGHANVLRDYGVTKVTSSNNGWFYNPGAYVVTVELKETGEIVGGERIHLAHKDFPLPIEQAVNVVDPNVHHLVSTHMDNKLTGELCGLWNAKSIAGKGVSFLLTKIGVVLANLLKMDSIFVLCAPYTVSLCQQVGFEIETSIGNQGTFFYPKLDLVATSLVIKDPKVLSHADPKIRQEIFNLIAQPNNTVMEHGPKGETEVEYRLSIDNITTP